MAGHALSHAPRVDEHERRLVLPDQLRNTIVDLFPDLVGHQCFERRTGNFDCQIQPAHVPGVDDGAVGTTVRCEVRRAHQKARDLCNRFLRR